MPAMPWHLAPDCTGRRCLVSTSRCLTASVVDAKESEEECGDRGSRPSRVVTLAVVLARAQALTPAPRETREEVIKQLRATRGA